MADDDYLFDEDPAEEGEEDLGTADLSAVEQAVVYSSDWTSETIVSQLRRGNIELSPAFQRRDAWRDDRKSIFIESLFLGLPIPQIVLAERKDKRGGFLVIDGKQRLTALWRFATAPDDRLAAAPDDPLEPLRLRSLQARSDLNGKTLAEMKEDPELAEDIAFFENQTIRTVVLRAWPDDDFLYRVFLRLNTGSVKLAPQELRQALLPGPFVSFVEERSAESEPIRRALNLSRPDFRMRDAELIVRYYAFANFLSEYTGNLKQFLDETCRHLNAAWGDREKRIRDDADRCDAGIEATFAVFDDNAFRRWTAEGWEGRFNRAIFDVMLFYFRIPSIAKAASANQAAVVDAYKRLSEDDPDFVDAVQSTTKSIEATHLRLARWGGELEGIVDAKIPVPQLVDNRIKPTH